MRAVAPARSRVRSVAAGCLSVLLIWTARARGEVVEIPNPSFERPVTAFVNILIEAWQKPPKPEGYDESQGYLWSQLTGVFKNTAPTSPDHIENCDGDQAIWLFAVPHVGLALEPAAMAGSVFTNAIFKVGSAYAFTVGVIGGGGNMVEGATLELSLSYRDTGSNVVRIATTVVTNAPGLFPTQTRLIDFTVRTPVVAAEDAWAGKPIRLELLSTVDSEREGGYWDVDHVRLMAIAEPVLSARPLGEGQVEVTVEGDRGFVYELLNAPRIDLPLSEWTHLTRLTNASGSASFTETLTNDPTRYYRAREVSRFHID